MFILFFSFYSFSYSSSYSCVSFIASLRNHRFVARIFRKRTTIYEDPWRVMSESSRIAVSTKGTNMIVYHRVCACMCARVCDCVYMSRHVSFRSNFLRSCVLDLRGEDCCCWSRESTRGMIRPVVRPRLILVGRYCHRCWNRIRHRQIWKRTFFCKYTCRMFHFDYTCHMCQWFRLF